LPDSNHGILGVNAQFIEDGKIFNKTLVLKKSHTSHNLKFRWALDRPLVPCARSCSVGKGTQGLDNFLPELTIPRRRTLVLGSDGTAGRCARVWSRPSRKQTAL